MNRNVIENDAYCAARKDGTPMKTLVGLNTRIITYMLANAVLACFACACAVARPPRQDFSKPIVTTTPSFSFDGAYVMFSTRCEADNRLHYSVVILSVPSWEQVALINNAQVSAQGGQGWAPKDYRIVLRRCGRDDKRSVDFIYDCESGTEQELMCDPPRNGHWKWSPLGTELLATMSFRHDMDVNAYVVRAADGAKAIRRSQFKSVHTDSVEWFNHGRSILVASGNTYTKGHKEDDGIYRLAREGETTSRWLQLHDVVGLELSPDELWLAIRVGGNVDSLAPHRVKLLRVGETHPLDVGSVSADGTLAWKPDSRELAFDNRAIHIYNVSDPTTSRRVADGEGTTSPFWHPKNGTLWGVRGDSQIVEYNDERWIVRFGIRDVR